MRENLSDIIHFVSVALQMEENATGLGDFWAGANLGSVRVLWSRPAQAPRVQDAEVQEIQAGLHDFAEKKTYFFFSLKP